MTGISRYIRPDLRAFVGYSSAATSGPGSAPENPVWLNANESPWANPADPAAAVRRYPSPQPPQLRAALAEMAGVAPEQVLIGRGSDELIDLLVRLACRPGGDAVLVSTPTFGMYEVAAQLNGSRLVDVPLRDDPDAARWSYPTDAAVDALHTDDGIRVAFLCSPGNPTGQAIPRDAIESVLEAARDRALVVVDEAYIDFTDAASVVELLAANPQLVVLRTLSKAHALAGARVGYAIAAPELVTALSRVQAPYPMPEPVARLAEEATSGDALALARTHVAQAREQRERLTAALQEMSATVYPSEANFLLIRVADPDVVLESLYSQGIVVRDARTHAALPDGVRITVGTPEQTDLVIATLRKALA